jgi:hypothetical protein
MAGSVGTFEPVLVKFLLRQDDNRSRTLFSPPSPIRNGAVAMAVIRW